MAVRKTGLSRFQVLRQLEVGPVVLEPDRLRVSYSVSRGAGREQTELIYRYEEPVFDPDSAASQNLAAMIGAQVALNYGLFCRRIVFRGPFDAHDRRFLREMARNTAREILVKKILEPNPFLTAEFRDIDAPEGRDILRAELVFPDAEPSGLERDAPWSDNRARHAVLSSGGKDSLLSYGLLDEIGGETHPIFLNESGRHWYTALNAHRSFREREPRTARVWTNSDRVFTWMLRQLPFVRPDFASVRADIYPVRLWTVAVFLFGALPILRARGIGRLIVGDEYDTTLRLRHRGITHYGGLYDQSRWFDDALSRYFGRKGWGVAQFSILRPLSELLIQRLLVDRYPELHADQMSCHAAHVVDGRVHPCGRCEKCRRIVSMLVAFEADPTACGYRAEQLEQALVDLAREGIHQESEGQEHLLFLLTEQGALDAEVVGLGRARPHPEVMKLRFHRERSPADAIPADLREPLYRIFLDHADGALQRQGRSWSEIDALGEDYLLPPYRYEAVGPNAPPSPPPQSASFRLAEMTSPEAARRLQQSDLALLPVGALEQHGPHLTLDVDTYHVRYQCHEVAAACPPPRPIVLPTIPYGVSYHHEGFPGTVSVSPETLSRLTYEVGLAAARQGITKLVIVNGHGGNSPALHFAAQRINRDANIFTCVETGETSDVEVEGLAETPNDVHAGEIETSLALALRPDLVDMEQAYRQVPRFQSDSLNFSSARSVEWYVRTEQISSTGVLGDPTRASADKGRRMWKVIVANLLALVRDLQAASLSDLHERRY